MANYNVDIAVSIKNADKLSKFNKQIKDVSLNIKSANQFISNFPRYAFEAFGVIFLALLSFFLVKSNKRIDEIC